MFSFDKRKEPCFCSICIEDTQSIEICENEIDNYVKAWKHVELNIKGKMPLERLEEMQSYDTRMSLDGGKVSNLAR